MFKQSELTFGILAPLLFSQAQIFPSLFKSEFAIGVYVKKGLQACLPLLLTQPPSCPPLTAFCSWPGGLQVGEIRPKEILRKLHLVVRSHNCSSRAFSLAAELITRSKRCYLAALALLAFQSQELS